MPTAIEQSVASFRDVVIANKEIDGLQLPELLPLERVVFE